MSTAESFIWRGLTFERIPSPNGIDGPFVCGHWTVWKPKRTWTAVWQDARQYVVAMQYAEEDDPTAALELLLSRLEGRLRMESAHVSSMEHALAPLKAACEALERDLRSLVYPPPGEPRPQLHAPRTLHLFAGAGGGILADLLLGHRPIGAVEIRPHCQAVLRQRIADGILPWFPLFPDVRKFDGRPWRGLVDILNGSFPCQPFSTASRGRKVAVDLWPEQRRIIGECRPRYAFAENVQREPIERAAWDLYADGYRTAFCELSAADLGAPHQRRRWWLMAADADGNSQLRLPIHAQAMAGSSSNAPLDWWADDRDAHRVSHGLASRMVRLGALGNGVVPVVETAAWLLLRPLVDD